MKLRSSLLAAALPAASFSFICPAAIKPSRQSVALNAESEHASSPPANRTCTLLKGMHNNMANDLLVRVARGELTERTPVWLFRQAGRHLPEYEAYKKQTGKNFVQLLQSPKDVAECTLQPVRRYNIDAAILFSDILVVAEALGIEVEMPGGKGILVPRPFKDPADMDTRLAGPIDVQTSLGHVLEAVTLIKKELAGKVPLIGFSAAPWTLMYYMVGGSSRKNTDVGTFWLRNFPEAAEKLMDRLTDVVIEYLDAQAERGADVLQVFEAMGKFIEPDDFYKHALPRLQRIAAELTRRRPDVPLMVFARDATYANAALQSAGYHVVTLDTLCDRAGSRAELLAAAASSSPSSSPSSRNSRNSVSAVQGNFNPEFLVSSTPEEVRAEVKKMLVELGPQKLIANLGEGLGGKEKVENVAAFVDAVHELSEAMIAESGSEGAQAQAQALQQQPVAAAASGVAVGAAR